MLYKFNDRFNAKLVWNWFTRKSDINTARNTGALTFDYRKDKLQINLHGFYRGKSEAVKGQDSFIIASVNTRYRYSNNLSFNLKIDNLFDKHFKTQTILYEEGIENRGRQLSLSASYLF